MKIDLKQKVVLVSGGSRGIGAAIVKVCAEAGADIAFTYIADKKSAEQVETAVKKFGRRCLVLKTSVSNQKQVHNAVRKTVHKFGRIDILVNNAGLQHIAPIPEFTEERWNHLIGVMLTGPFLTTKYAFPHMQAQKRGRIINISSTQGLVSAEFKCAYVAAKHGVLGLTKVTALEGAPHGITAVAVCPCFIRTPLAEKQIAGQAKFHGMSEQEVVEKIMLAPAALKRLLEPEEVAALVVYLATDVAQCITGSAVPIDCGWTAR